MIISMVETIGQILKCLMVEKGLSQRKLAELSDVDREYINQMIAGKVKSTTLRTARKLAKGLGVEPGVFFGEAPERPLRFLLHEAQRRYDALELVELPVRGTVPAGYPFSMEQEAGEFIEVPRQELGGASPESLYALKISGDSLQGDEIYSGDMAVVNREDMEIVDGKIYIIRLGNEVCARHVFKQDDRLRLVSSNGEYKELLATEVEILGRMILSGRWKRH